MPGGHFGPVKDLSWAPSGDYLISASTDQSVRVCGEWQGQGWYELARSQVHGHDLSCASFISDSTYFSGSEEKVLRVFQVVFSLQIRFAVGRALFISRIIIIYDQNQN